MAKLPTIIDTFYQSFNTGKISNLNTILVPNWTNHTNDPGQAANIEGLKAGIVDFREAFDNFSLKIIKVIQENNNIAVHLQMSGTQVKSYAGIASAQKPVVFYGFDRHQLNSNHTQILETWHFEDFSNLR